MGGRPHEPKDFALEVDFDRWEQTRRLFFKSFLWRWLVTIVLCGIVAGVVFVYQARSPTPGNEIWLVDSTNFASSPAALSTSQYHWLQTLVTGLQIGISVNITICRKKPLQTHCIDFYIREGRVGALCSKIAMDTTFARTPRSRSTTCDETINLVKILFNRNSRRPLRCFALFWVLLFLAAQIGTATIGLTYEVGSSADVSVRRTTEMQMGNITALDIVGPYPNRLQGLNNQRKYSNDAFRASLLLTNPGSYLRFYSPPDSNGTIWALNLTNYGTPLQGSAYERISSNSIGVYSNNGIGYPLSRVIRGNCTCIEHQNQTISTSDDSSALTYYNGTTLQTRTFPFRADNDTTRVLFLGPASERAVELLVFWGNSTNNASFTCTNQIWQAANYAGMGDGLPVYAEETDTTRQMPSSIAQVWAGAMTWTSADPADDRQGNAYDNDNILNTRPDSNAMENTIARKTLLALHIHDLSGPPVPQASLQAVVPSYSVSPKRPYIELNLALITGLHLLLAVSIALVARRVPILDESPLAMSALLSDAAQEVGLERATSSAKTLHTLRRSSDQEPVDTSDSPNKTFVGDVASGNQGLIYGWHKDGDQRRLVIGSKFPHELQRRGKGGKGETGLGEGLRTRTFDDGRYKLW